jgi:carboxylesterase type B
VPQPSPAPGVPTCFDPDRGFDWLTLNVWSPDPGRARLPVTVWLHGTELPFVFGNHGNRFAGRFLGDPPPPEFAPLSAAMRRAWTGFATTGDPGWPRYETGSAGPVRRWDTEPADVRHPYISA